MNNAAGSFCDLSGEICTVAGLAGYIFKMGVDQFREAILNNSGWKEERPLMGKCPVFSGRDEVLELLIIVLRRFR